MDQKNLLLIFTRNPEPGKCKTRLAAVIGDVAALEVYKILLQHTRNISKPLEVVKTVYYSEVITENDLWENEHYSKKLQDGASLGERMANAFQTGFENGYQNIIVIGSDLYDLSTADLQKGFEALDKHNYVIGPATDGGYYLLGMKFFNKSLFEGKKWGTSTVLEDSLKDIVDGDYVLLEPKNDIDVYEDIKGIKVFEKFLKAKE